MAATTATDRTDIDVEAAASAVRALLLALGQDPDRDGLRDTPARVARAYAELLAPSVFNMTTFPNEERYDELVLVSGIPFVSLCEHHLLPFAGLAHVAYVPDGRLLGLSKLPRVVDHFAGRLQLQERLTVQVAEWLMERLQPRGVGVVVQAEHSCMSLRGVRKPGTRTVTSALHGLLRDDERTRQEFLRLADAN